MLFIALANFSIGQTNVVTLELPNPCTTNSIRNMDNLEYDFSISPNPSTGDFILNLTGSERLGKLTIRISDTKGNLVFQEQIYSGNARLVKSYKFNHLHRETYYVTIVGKGFRKTQKLIIL